jgi:hypothetical protein
MRQVAILAIALAGWAPQAVAMTTGTHDALPFIADDYGKALTQARAQKKPIFVEAWAPW